MKIQDLITTSNSFLRLSAGTDLQSLLRSTLQNNDNESFQVFLDVLEEKNADLKKRIISGDLRNTMMLLSRYFNNIIDYKDFNRIFTSPYFPFKSIVIDEANHFEIMYKDHTVTSNGDRIVLWTLGTFDGQIHMIVRDSSSLRAYDENGERIVLTYEIEEKCANIISAKYSQAKKDYDNLKQTLSIPDTWAEFGYTVIAQGGDPNRIIVYKRDTPATGLAADLAPFTFPTKAEAEEQGRRGNYAYKKKPLEDY